MFADGPRPRGPADRHGAVEVDGERVAVFVQSGPSWPTPEVNERGAVLVKLRDPNVARAFFYGSAGKSYGYVVERAGGVALPALVRRVRKRAGSLPPVTCARIARDLVRAQQLVDELVPSARYRTESEVAAMLADAVVSWDGRVVIAPRMFGTPADAPPWLETSQWTQSLGRLLFALLAPAEALSADVDASLGAVLPTRPQLTGTGSPALEQLAFQMLDAVVVRATRRRVRPRVPEPSALVRKLDDIVTALGGDDESFAAGLMRELFDDRRRADLAWREELAAAALS